MGSLKGSFSKALSTRPQAPVAVGPAMVIHTKKVVTVNRAKVQSEGHHHELGRDPA